MNLAEIFKHVKVVGSCWMWQLSCDKNGYALARVEGSTTRLSREVYKLTNDCRLSESQHVLHTCDVPGCLNPAHLYLGTHQDNMADMVAKERAHKPEGELNGRAKLTREIVEQIRKDYESGGVTQARLAKKYNTPRGTIGQILTYRTWI